MKKIIILMLILNIFIMFSACTDHKTSQENNSEESLSTEDDETVRQPDSTVIRFSSIKEYIDDVLSKTDEDAFRTDFLTNTVYVEQDTVVYDYTYIEQYDNIAEIKQIIDDSYDPENETAKHLLSEIKRYVDVENPKIKYIYRNNDGT